MSLEAMKTVFRAGLPMRSKVAPPLAVVRAQTLIVLPSLVSWAEGISTTMAVALKPVKKSTVLASQNIRLPPAPPTWSRKACRSKKNGSSRRPA